MTSVTVKVEGLVELDAALAELLTLASTSTGKNALRAAGRKSLQGFDASWRAKVRERTGRLKASGGVGSKLSRRQRRAAERQSLVEVFAGPGPLVEAITEEFGTFKQAAHPSVRPAWDETKDSVLTTLKTELGNEIAKRTARARKKAAKLAGG